MLIVCAHCQATNRVPDERLAEDPVCGTCGQALLDGHPVTLTDATFDKFTARTELPVVVDFWADWCGPCKMMAPAFEAAAGECKGRVVFAKVDSDANPQVAARFGIRSIPTLVKLKGGAEAGRVAGAQPKGAILKWVSQG